MDEERYNIMTAHLDQTRQETVAAMNDLTNAVWHVRMDIQGQDARLDRAIADIRADLSTIYSTIAAVEDVVNAATQPTRPVPRRQTGLFRYLERLEERVSALERIISANDSI